MYIKFDIDNCPSIDLSLIDKKITTFIGLSNESTTPSDYVEIYSSKNVDLTLTTTVFTDIFVKPSLETANLTFGELRFDNAIVDSSFKNVEVSLNR